MKTFKSRIIECVENFQKIKDRVRSPLNNTLKNLNENVLTPIYRAEFNYPVKCRKCGLSKPRKYMIHLPDENSQFVCWLCGSKIILAQQSVVLANLKIVVNTTRGLSPVNKNDFITDL